MGMMVATGGSMRWEIIQNAISSLPAPRLKRRATVCSSSTNTPVPAATPSGHGQTVEREEDHKGPREEGDVRKRHRRKWDRRGGDGPAASSNDGHRAHAIAVTRRRNRLT